MFWFFGREACETLALDKGIELTPRAWEGEVLTTGPPGKFSKWVSADEHHVGVQRFGKCKGE